MPGTDITQKNRSEMKFYSTLLLTEGKRWEETQNTCPKSLSCFFACDIHANLNNTHFSSPWLNNSVYLFRSRTIGAHPISPPYSFYFITTITFLVLSNLERYIYAQLLHFLWQIFLKTISKRKYVSTNRAIPCQN